jgi:hypothetical protein
MFSRDFSLNFYKRKHINGIPTSVDEMKTHINRDVTHLLDKIFSDSQTIYNALDTIEKNLPRSSTGSLLYDGYFLPIRGEITNVGRNYTIVPFSHDIVTPVTMPVPIATPSRRHRRRRTPMVAVINTDDLFLKISNTSKSTLYVYTIGTNTHGGIDQISHFLFYAKIDITGKKYETRVILYESQSAVYDIENNIYITRFLNDFNLQFTNKGYSPTGHIEYFIQLNDTRANRQIMVSRSFYIVMFIEKIYNFIKNDDFSGFSSTASKIVLPIWSNTTHRYTVNIDNDDDIDSLRKFTVTYIQSKVSVLKSGIFKVDSVKKKFYDRYEKVSDVSKIVYTTPLTIPNSSIPIQINDLIRDSNNFTNQQNNFKTDNSLINQHNLTAALIPLKKAVDYLVDNKLLDKDFPRDRVILNPFEIIFCVENKKKILEYPPDQNKDDYLTDDPFSTAVTILNKCIASQHTTPCELNNLISSLQSLYGSSVGVITDSIKTTIINSTLSGGSIDLNKLSTLINNNFGVSQSDPTADPLMSRCMIRRVTQTGSTIFNCGNIRCKSDGCATTMTKDQNLVKRFIIDNRTILLFHATGTGKTKASINMIGCLLKQYVFSKVYFISPSKTNHKMKTEIIDCGLDPMENYHIETITHAAFVNEKDSRKFIGSIIVIDEVHKLRSQGENTTIIVNHCYMACRVILMTATPYLNNKYDLEMLRKILNSEKLPDTTGPLRPPPNINEIRDIDDTLTAKFKCRVSYEPRPSSGFPRENTIVRKILVSDPDRIKQHMEIMDSRHAQKTGLHSGNDFEPVSSVAYGKTRILLDVVWDEKYNELQNVIIPAWQNDCSMASRSGFEVPTGIVVYAHFQDAQKKLGELCRRLSLPSKIINGFTSQSNVSNYVKRFNEKNIDILIIGDSGKEGLDLKKTWGIVLFSNVFTYGDYMQIVGRGVRRQSHKTLDPVNQQVNVYILKIEFPQIPPSTLTAPLPQYPVLTDPPGVFTNASCDILRDYLKVRNVRQAGMSADTAIWEIVSVNQYVTMYVESLLKNASIQEDTSCPPVDRNDYTQQSLINCRLSLSRDSGVEARKAAIFRKYPIYAQDTAFFFSKNIIERSVAPTLDKNAAVTAGLNAGKFNVDLINTLKTTTGATILSSYISSEIFNALGKKVQLLIVGKGTLDSTTQPIIETAAQNILNNIIFNLGNAQNVIQPLLDLRAYLSRFKNKLIDGAKKIFVQFMATVDFQFTKRNITSARADIDRKINQVLLELDIISRVRAITHGDVLVELNKVT